MSKSKDLRLLVDKTKKELVKEIDRIVEWNLDESKIPAMPTTLCFGKFFKNTPSLLPISIIFFG